LGACAAPSPKVLDDFFTRGASIEILSICVIGAARSLT
jgi:hypothetical protein